MAEDFLISQKIDLNTVELKDYTSEQIQKRVDQHFTYKIKNSELETSYGEGYLQYQLIIQGNSVGSYMMYFFIPENFTRELEKLTSNRFIKSAFMAMFLAVFVWAIGHSNYPVFPVYFRGIELVLDGMLWGYFILRYNIATTITAHYLYNTLLDCISLILSLNVIYLGYSFVLLLLPVVVAIIHKFYLSYKYKNAYSVI